MNRHHTLAGSRQKLTHVTLSTQHKDAHGPWASANRSNNQQSTESTFQSLIEEAQSNGPTVEAPLALEEPTVWMSNNEDGELEDDDLMIVHVIQSRTIQPSVGAEEEQDLENLIVTSLDDDIPSKLLSPFVPSSHHQLQKTKVDIPFMAKELDPEEVHLERIETGGQAAVISEDDEVIKDRILAPRQRIEPSGSTTQRHGAASGKEVARAMALADVPIDDEHQQEKVHTHIHIEDLLENPPTSPKSAGSPRETSEKAWTALAPPGSFQEKAASEGIDHSSPDPPQSKATGVQASHTSDPLESDEFDRNLEKTTLKNPKRLNGVEVFYSNVKHDNAINTIEQERLLQYLGSLYQQEIQILKVHELIPGLNAIDLMDACSGNMKAARQFVNEGMVEEIRDVFWTRLDDIQLFSAHKDDLRALLGRHSLVEMMQRTQYLTRTRHEAGRFVVKGRVGPEIELFGCGFRSRSSWKAAAMQKKRRMDVS